MMTFLEQVRCPDGQSSSEKTQEHFDSYLTKLQSLCNNPNSEFVAYNNLTTSATDDNRPFYETVKSAIQDYNILPPTVM